MKIEKNQKNSTVAGWRRSKHSEKKLATSDQAQWTSIRHVRESRGSLFKGTMLKHTTDSAFCGTSQDHHDKYPIDPEEMPR